MGLLQQQLRPVGCTQEADGLTDSFTDWLTELHYAGTSPVQTLGIMYFMSFYAKNLYACADHLISDTHPSH